MNRKKVEDSVINYYATSGLIIFLPVGLYIIFGATMYQWLEKLSIVDSYYYVIVTLSTVGYGDIVPKTDAGKIFTIFFIIFGIAIFSSLISTLVNRAKARREHRQMLRSEKKKA
jgi:voltage-gated potassium channel